MRIQIHALSSKIDGITDDARPTVCTAANNQSKPHAWDLKPCPDHSEITSITLIAGNDN